MTLANFPGIKEPIGSARSLGAHPIARVVEGGSAGRSWVRRRGWGRADGCFGSSSSRLAEFGDL